MFVNLFTHFENYCKYLQSLELSVYFLKINTKFVEYLKIIYENNLQIICKVFNFYENKTRSLQNI